MKMSEEYIQNRLRVYAQEQRYLIGNAFIFNWESDFFSVTKSHYSVEYEIKISIADFQKDVKKKKHFLFTNCSKGIFFERGKTHFEKDRKWSRMGDNMYKKGNDKYESTYAAHSDVEWHDISKCLLPNQFYYVVPAGMISAYAVPSYAGLLHVHKEKIMTVKKAPLLHKRKIILEDASFIRILLEKFYWMSHDQRKELDRNGISFRARTNVYAK